MRGCINIAHRVYWCGWVYEFHFAVVSDCYGIYASCGASDKVCCEREERREWHKCHYTVFSRVAMPDYICADIQPDDNMDNHLFSEDHHLCAVHISNDGVYQENTHKSIMIIMAISAISTAQYAFTNLLKSHFSITVGNPRFLFNIFHTQMRGVYHLKLFLLINKTPIADIATTTSKSNPSGIIEPPVLVKCAVISVSFVIVTVMLVFLPLPSPDQWSNT